VSILPGIYASQITGHLSTSSYESIATVTVGAGGAADVTFSSIPSTYKHLQIRAISRLAGGGDIFMQYNGDTTTNYARHFVYGDGASAVAGNNLTTQSGGYTSNSTSFGAQIIDILDYTNTNKFKTSRMLTGFDNNGSGFIVFYSGLWRDTSAINSIKLIASGTTFNQYSSFALYGVKG
jgi:hypothetical protein